MFENPDSAIPDTGVVPYDGFNLFDFDPKTTDFCLSIATTDKVNQTVVSLDHNIAGSIDATGTRRIRRIRNERFTVQLGPVPVTERDTPPPREQLQVHLEPRVPACHSLFGRQCHV